MPSESKWFKMMAKLIIWSILAALGPKLHKMIQNKPLYRAFEFSKHSADVGIVLVVQLPQALHCAS